MEFEFIDLSTYLASGKNIQQYDYLYNHSLTGYPLRKDFDANDYYLVTEVDSTTGIIYALRMGGKSNNSNVTFKSSQFSGHWWILSLPYVIKQQIFLSLP
jgi:hypothetical protein